MKRWFPFLQFHRRSPVYSLRVHWIRLFPSFHRLRAFAMWTAFPSSDYYALSAISWGLGVSLGSPLPTFHPPIIPGDFPCSSSRTQATCCRWRVVKCPVRSLRLPSIHTGYDRFTRITDSSTFLIYYFSPYFHLVCMVSGSTGRHIRQGVSGSRFPEGLYTLLVKSPWHISAKHHFLRACLPLMVPFRSMLLTS